MPFNVPGANTRPTGLHIELEKPCPPTEISPAYHEPKTSRKAKNQIFETIESYTSSPTASNPNTAPTTPGELEKQTLDFAVSNATTPVQSVDNPRINRFRLLSACSLIFVHGLSDAASGAVIPYMQPYYGLGYGTVSVIFLAQAAGFIVGAFCSQPLHRATGRAITIMLGTTMLGTATFITAMAPPFGAVVFAFFLTGCAMSFLLAQINVFCASLANSTVLLGYAHGCYGAGGTVAPLIATTMVSKGIRWSYFYFILFGLCVVNCATGGYIFWDSEKNSIPSAMPSSEAPQSRRKVLKKSIVDKASIMTACFVFAYQGVEVSTSGWLVTFLITVRRGVYSKVGYVSTGFWAGLTLGRFVLSHACSRYGECRSVFVLIAVSLVFQILVWQVPNIVADAVFESIFGFLTGPLYPAGITVATQLIPTELHVSSLSLISAVGASGGAVAPFTTGVLAGKFGAWILYPVTIALLGVMEVIWFIQPRIAGKK